MGCILGLICGARGGDFEQRSHENVARVEEQENLLEGPGETKKN